MKFHDEYLLLCTTQAFQVWTVEPQCLFSRRVPDVCMVELFQHHLIFVTFEQKTQVNIFSLAENKTTRVHSVPCPVRKIQQADKLLLILLLDGTL
jgi:predicted MarR family transcription regulator